MLVYLHLLRMEQKRKLVGQNLKTNLSVLNCVLINCFGSTTVLYAGEAENIQEKETNKKKKGEEERGVLICRLQTDTSHSCCHFQQIE